MRVTNNKDNFLIQAFNSVLFILNLGLALILLSSYITWNVSPEKNPFFAYIGLGFPVILISNVLFLILWMLKRRWKFVLFDLVILILCIQPIWAYSPLNIISSKPAEGSIKVLSYNVKGMGWNMDESWDKKPIMKYIKEQKADIICMQEYMASTNDNYATSKKLQKYLADYPYYYVESLRSKHGGYEYGLACFSKYKIESVKRIPLNTSDNGAVLFKVQVGDKLLSLFNLHLESNRITDSDKRIYKEFIKDTGSSTFHKVTNSIETKLGVAFAKRATQADMIAHYVKEQNTDGSVVCGDFNDTPISYTYRTIEKNMVDSYTETRFGPSITYHESYFWFRIDYIFHSNNMNAYNFKINKVKYSDHYPVMTYLSWKD